MSLSSLLIFFCPLALLLLLHRQCDPPFFGRVFSSPLMSLLSSSLHLCRGALGCKLACFLQRVVHFQCIEDCLVHVEVSVKVVV